MTVPQNAKKVFSGIIFDVYQWEQELFDGSSSTFEMLKRPNTLKVIPIVEGKILVAKEEQPSVGTYLGLFGGRQEKNETALLGIKRELLEETGLTSDSWQEFFTFSLHPKILWKKHVFIAKNCVRSDKPNLDAGEKCEQVFCTFKEFVDIVFSEEFKDIGLKLELIKFWRRDGNFEGLRKLLLD